MKKKINFLLISKRLRFIGTFFNFIMFFIPFLPCVQLISGATKRNYGPAYSFIFGGKISSTNISYSAKGISPIFLISFLLILFAFLTLIYSFFAQNKKNTNISSILTFS